MKQHNVEMNILVKGKPIKEYSHNGNTYVEGRHGSEFEIQIKNHNYFQIEAVISVDGLSITDGKSAGESSKGYLLHSQETITIPGWKLDNDSAAAFFFSTKKESYAANNEEGSTRNNGVIGLMIFGEKISYPVLRTLYANTPMNCASTMTLNSTNIVASSAIGTGFGNETDFKTKSVNFNRGDLLGISTIYYDTKEGLSKRGIKFVSKRKNREPNPFPAMGCTPPKNWRRG